MGKIIRLFKVSREELWPSLAVLAMVAVLNALAIYKYSGLFTHTGMGYWNVFVNNFRVSGFDPITYSIVSHWSVLYDVYRHPLLAFMMYPLSCINGWVMEATGFNPVQFTVAAVLLFCAYYSFIFMRRILRSVVGLPKGDATLLAVMLFSFAYVMLAAAVPDHFIISLFLLLLTLYVAGMKMRGGGRMKAWQTVALFAVTAGVTLSNGVKVFLAALFVNGRRFFRPAFLCLAVIVPSALIWMFCRWEHRKYVMPREQKTEAQKLAQQRKDISAIARAWADSTGTKDSAEIARAAMKLYRKHIHEVYLRNMKDPWNAHAGKPISKGGFLRWTDVTTPRTETIVENLFGESVQLHRQHLLEDTLRSRPVIVRYGWAANYAAEALVALLFAAGVWCGRRQRFLWLCLSCFAFDMALHLGLGFGINEVYIMGAHWLFVIPVAAGFLLKGLSGRALTVARAVAACLTAWLLAYNFYLAAGYLAVPAAG